MINRLTNLNYANDNIITQLYSYVLKCAIALSLNSLYSSLSR